MWDSTVILVRGLTEVAEVYLEKVVLVKGKLVKSIEMESAATAVGRSKLAMLKAQLADIVTDGHNFQQVW